MNNEIEQAQEEIDILERIKIAINDNKCCFLGVSETEILTLTTLFNNARKENGHGTNFPDFVCDTGIIEHFKITSSREDKKGSAQIITEKAILRKIRTYYKEHGTLLRHVNYTSPEHHYDLLYKSLEKNFRKHIVSLDKYVLEHGDTIGLRIFIVEYLDNGLIMHTEENANLRTPWSLLCDKYALRYLFGFKDKLDYVVCVTGTEIQIIKLAEILNTINLLPTFDMCSGTPSQKMSSYIGIYHECSGHL